MDAPFPDGPWRGFYPYSSIDDERHWMDLELSFREGSISGLGSDDVGPFVIRGRYDGENLEAHWTKIYVGQHSVYYTGYGESGAIWGTWDLPSGWTGGFKIWPKSRGASEAREAEVEIPEPASAP